MPAYTTEYPKPCHQTVNGFLQLSVSFPLTLNLRAKGSFRLIYRQSNYQAITTIEDWVELRKRHKLKKTTLGSLEDPRSGSKTKPEQFSLFRILWSPLKHRAQFKAASDIERFVVLTTSLCFNSWVKDPLMRREWHGATFHDLVDYETAYFHRGKKVEVSEINLQEAPMWLEGPPEYDMMLHWRVSGDLPDPAVQSELIDGGKKRQFDNVTPGEPHWAKRHEAESACILELGTRRCSYSIKEQVLHSRFRSLNIAAKETTTALARAKNFKSIVDQAIRRVCRLRQKETVLIYDYQVEKIFDITLMVGNKLKAIHGRVAEMKDAYGSKMNPNVLVNADSVLNGPHLSNAQFVADENYVGEALGGDKPNLKIKGVKRALQPGTPVTLFMTSYYSGGWSVQPNAMTYKHLNATALILDEGQMAYRDEVLWIESIKNRTGSHFGPRICLFTCYGSPTKDPDSEYSTGSPLAYLHPQQ
ncbi:hypothetical protein CNMCM5793_009388 [Aspergillus hiratsukae]|uniref:Uncharacterized protein n=1 Tax=Aspergillus hiratsukae TaxID=1194566 RepID=A0A8H6UI72_9EURO|nr:hypothetical protein CNMCM5793_009388 [Aspergillus hiratsukae]KAF7155758.1 hypothetical protein CNMCM6106_007023 [Aspergillus hiratsukae]KAF7155773.1 hypothetical protein CNMCM6106_007038 [Aspergillus hiratsukae]